jgi:hypothetical protein
LLSIKDTYIKKKERHLHHIYINVYNLSPIVILLFVSYIYFFFLIFSVYFIL